MRIRQEEADRLKTEAEGLKNAAWLEDLHIGKMEKEKTTKRAQRSSPTGWRHGVRAPGFGTFIWAAAGRWMPRQQGRRPK